MKRFKHEKVVLFVAGVFLLVCARPLRAAETLREAFTEGKFNTDIRLRYEFVDQDGFDKDAHAGTGRTRVGFRTAEFMNLTAGIEAENISYLGPDNYNDTVNGRTDRPTVADPESTEINQAYLQFSGIPDTTLKGGRQVITLDGHRFIGNVGWRQNDQVYDAVLLTNHSVPETELKYGYIYNVNRIFGEQSAAGDWESDSHFYHIANTSLPLGTVAAHGYFLDFEHDSPANSSRTFAVSLSGQRDIDEDVLLKYYAEYAYQSDYAKNPNDYHADYYHLAPSLVTGALTTTLGYEVLGSDNGRFAFRTPLATLHKWNGWADQFLTTPDSGLRDLYADLTYKVSGLSGGMDIFNGLLGSVQYHSFDSDEGGLHHGDEWGVYLKKAVGEYVSVDGKFAQYFADDTAADVTKVIFGVTVVY